MLTTALLLPGYKPIFGHRSHDNRVKSECLHPAFSGLEAVSGGPSGIVGTREPRDMRCLSDRHFSRLQSGKVYDLSTCRTQPRPPARADIDAELQELTMDSRSAPQRPTVRFHINPRVASL